jgi:hypothetical protein
MAMATHPTTGRPLLMGGSTAPGAEKGDTWEFQGSRWALITTATWPVSREAHAMATDTGRRVVVLFGGDRRATSSGSTAEFRSDTLLFDGRDWTRTAIVGPPARGFHAMAYSAEEGAVVMFGGGQAWQGAPLGDTWLFRGTHWERGNDGPAARFSHAMAYDEARGGILMFGGATNASSYLADTWEFRGNAWRRLYPKSSPAGRRNHRMAYDPRRQRVVLMGGETARGVVGDTWDWDGERWVEQATGGPADRSTHGVATDRARNTVVLFGGSPAAGSRLNDTWDLVSTVPHSVSPLGAACFRVSPGPLIQTIRVPLAGSPDFAIRVSRALPGARIFVGMSHTSGRDTSVFPCVSYLGAPAAFFGLVADPSGQASVLVPIPWLLRGESIYFQARAASPDGASGGFDYTQALHVVVGD